MLLPHFIIKNNPQQRGYLYSDILTPEILADVCRRVTGSSEYTYEFDEEGYNKGRLATIEFNGTVTYVSFSDTGAIIARNSFFQSLTTAFVRYSRDLSDRKRICFYFLPLEGNIETNYFKFMYRLMATAGIEFLNANEFLEQQIDPFTSIDDLIAARYINRGRNSSNNSTYITKNSQGITEIYGKTYGASKKETALICIAASRITPRKIDLYEICEQNLTELPAPDLEIIQSLENVKIIPTDLTMERNALLNNESLRSPRFTYSLLQKLGPKKCAFCECEIPELIEGAHIWSVADIRNTQHLSDAIKFEHAIDGDNGIWLCENHHTMLDVNLLRINENGELECRVDLEAESIEYIKNTTPITQIIEEIFTTKFVEYLKERNKIVMETQYNLL